MKFQPMFLPAVMIIIGLSSMSYAADVPAKPTAPDPKKVLEDQLRKGDVKEQADAIKQMNAWFDKDAKDAGDAFAKQWGRALFDTNHFDEILELIPRAQAAKPNDGWYIAGLNVLKVRTLLKTERFDEALTIIDARFKQNASDAGGEFGGNYAQFFYDAQHYDEVIRRTREGILARPQDVGYVEGLIKWRIRALTAAGKTDEALLEAKSLYNIASMGGTADALSILARQLGAAHPNDSDIIDRLRREQIVGAATQPAPTAANNTGGSILNLLPVDEKPYLAQLAAYPEEDYTGLVRRGNLLLLANKPSEAMKLFERAYALADQKGLSQASENIARCMKAIDGTVGRANAWVLSIRPPAETKAK